MEALTLNDMAGRVSGAIREAAKRTGAGFDYLFRTATRESSLNPQARSGSSSATGLFQFIDQTWLATLKEEGAKHGYGDYANAISRTSSGRFEVTDPAVRQQVMNLRYDPVANALMAGAYTQRNADHLTATLGRSPRDGELYVAHFLGPAGASRLIESAQDTPQKQAAELFPAAADSNRPIFFDKDGRARSVSEVMTVLTRSFNGSPSSPPAPASPVRALGFAAEAAEGIREDTAPIFQSLYSSGPRSSLSGTVQALWAGEAAAGRPAPAPSSSRPSSPAVTAPHMVSAPSSPAPAIQHDAAAKQYRTAANLPLDLMSFLKPDIRSAQIGAP